MAVGENSAAENSHKGENDSSNSPLSPRTRTKDPGIRVRNGRIYDSENGKTCHQCRQKTRDFAAFCKKLKNDKPCPLTFCHKCLFNRYGEKADEVGKLEDWMCPKCRGVCNCSFCMKRKGYEPTGILAHTAKATGYNSVHELLHNKGEEVLEPRGAGSNASPKKSPPSNKGSTASKRSRDKENQCVEQNDAKPNEEELTKNKKKGSKRLKCTGSDKSRDPVAADGAIRETPCKTRRHSSRNGDTGANQDKENAGSAKVKPLREVHKSKKLAKAQSASMVLPQGRPLTEVAGVELPAKDIGAALQFLEFCNAFSEVLGIKKGQPESILRNLTSGRVKRRGVCSTPVEFSIKLLSLMEDDTKKDGDTWLQTLKRCIEDSECTLKELPLDFIDRGSSGYDNLESSEKLKILNFLCDEVLVTEELRNWIDEVASKFDEGMKEHKEEILAVKKKEKLLKQKTKDETAKAMLSARGGAPLSLAEFDALLSQLKSESDKVHAEVLASLELFPKKNQRSDAVRTDDVTLGSNGQIFWKLSGYNSRSNIILQDIGNWDSATSQDKWFIYNEEEEKVVEKYISSLRNPAPIKHMSDDAEDGAKSDSSGSPGPDDCLPEEEVGA